MICPGSVRMSAGLPSAAGYHARQGTAAHELADWCLTNGHTADRRAGETITVGNDVFVIDEEMVEAIDLYCEEVRGAMAPGSELMVEHGFDLSHLYPGMFGTNDACVYDERTKRLTVFDLKYGVRPVEVVDNPQLMYYAYGAATAQARPLRHIELVIVQPRASHRDGPVRRWSLSPLDLLDWSGDLVAAARRTEAPNAPLAAGEWCEYCPAAGICPALKDRALAAARADFAEPATEMAPAELAAIMKETDVIEAWIGAVRARVLTLLEAGTAVPGFKLVQKRAQRRWRDDDQIRLALQLQRTFGLTHTNCYQPPKLLSPAQIEKLLPKDARAAMAEFTIKESSGVTVAPETDGREAVRPVTAADIFEAI